MGKSVRSFPKRILTKSIGKIIWQHFNSTAPRIVPPKTVFKKSRFSDRVECLECGNEYINLLLHVRQIHGTEEYIEKYGKDVMWFGNDYLVHMQKVARKTGSLKKTAIARKKYWSDSNVIKNKAAWMRKTVQGYWDNPKKRDYMLKINAERGIIKIMKDKFNSTASERRTCVICGTQYGHKLKLRSDGYLGHRDVGKAWGKRLYCSRRCSGIAVQKLKGKKYVV